MVRKYLSAIDIRNFFRSRARLYVGHKNQKELIENLDEEMWTL